MGSVKTFGHVAFDVVVPPLFHGRGGIDNDQIRPTSRKINS